MMTPDGITEKDWELVRDLSAKIASAECRDKIHLAAAYVTKMNGLLTALEGKYGPLPSILATRADYTSSPRKKLALLLRAHAKAVKRSDKLNCTLLASSIAQVYIEELANRAEGERWLARLRRRLKRCPDKGEARELKRLSEVCRRLKRQ